MIWALALVSIAQLGVFVFALVYICRHFETLIHTSMAYSKAKDLNEAVEVEQRRKTYDVQLAHMKDNLAKEAAELKKQAMVKDELTGRLVDLNQYDIL